MPTAQILTIGDELLSGDTVNTNLAFLGERLRQLGFEVVRALSVRDRIPEIVAAIGEVSVDLCLVSGGLGPTSDDLTAEAVALAAGVPLVRDAASEAAIAAMFAAMGRPMPDINRKQADLPAGCDVLQNPIGTAPGFAVGLPRGSYVACMPGVPREMKRMMTEQIEPRLRRRFALPDIPRRIYRLIGRGESAVAVEIEPILAAARARSPGLAAVYLHYRAATPQVLLILEGLAGEGGARATEEELRSFDAPFQAALGSSLYGIGEAELEVRVLDACRLAGLTLATAESCTGGQVAARLTAIAGSSQVFQGGVVAYANGVKTAVLGVAEDTLQTHGAVSEPVARAMAEGARRALSADVAVAITGIAGPGGGTPEKPVGTVDFAVADAEGCMHKRVQLWGDRALIQHVAGIVALKLVWDRLVARGLARVCELDAAGFSGDRR
ncbi:CinA family nicotinamide mononucleotide deamidase-related protein [Nannocystis sp. SCPEA4]|uniref:CinA family nicotinamide mononucleotide deamidase-related protein n=1 Tax=Nannocystis sp. SCPEA4 TaxID=2996787 RepID=UPI00226F4F77|nr:CinA family nicotinamide mononucleotide deamidase-related protein [Nannocystis sp. SCPEA4]MCY1058024.1 CinA family nicotinamide mononucleotide deamidase-related protein [Nannocystis sp. SCPEA4]